MQNIFRRFKSYRFRQFMKYKIPKNEQRVNNAIVDAWNSFMKLDKQRPDEVEEFRRNIHSLQAIMATRIARKVCPDVYLDYGDKT